MSPLLNEVPVDWLIHISVAQCRAMEYLTHANSSDQSVFIYKSALFASWLLNRTGVFTIEDQIQISVVLLKQTGGIEVDTASITKLLTSLYSTMDEVFVEEKQAKRLVGDIMGREKVQ